MFFVSDSIAERQEKIRSFLETDPVVAVLLAAADFEWCLNRFIIALGTKPNKEIRDEVLSSLNKKGFRSYVSGLTDYERAWKKSAASSNDFRSLEDIISHNQWKALKDAFNLRNELIHGRKGTTGPGYAAKRVEVILDCSSILN